MEIRVMLQPLLVSAILLSAALAASASEVPCPAKAPAAEPSLTHGADGRVYLSWIERTGQTASLKFAVWETDAWSEPRLVASGDDWFVNWADFPSLCALRDGTLAAHWLQKSSPGTYSYDVRMRLSRDGGQTWVDVGSPHRDGTHTEHGFVSIVAFDETRFGVVWLDGRAMVDETGAMSLRYTTLSRDGKFGDELLVDDRVCECCQTSAVAPANGANGANGEVVVVYRDRSETETRDISAAWIQGGQVQRRMTVNADGWMIEGCPVNGPALDRRGSAVVVAWPTSANDMPEVRARFLGAAGQPESAVIRIDEGGSIGRVDVAILDTGLALVSWVASGDGTAGICWRTVSRDGTRGPIHRLAATTTSRATGFPRVVADGRVAFFAWTDSARPPRIRTARVVLPR